ncbi:acyl carrier protein [Paenibacillus hexagrammi]|uniref:Acyl carrier protein n=1 Tax=Paenibacillus hexagrammi TaxID=2908839 RepID=A0ABY3SKL2_9BACL|nr:acyl carrier protein [Paenibacillus sp. YPD9-1]UJF34496.1 acyl carrier protein [Paenibacillus sp. YPD9-1]
MTNMEIKNQIKEALQGLAAGVEQVELNDEVLLSDLGVDSIKYVELLVLIEEGCSITFDESDLGMEGLRSIGDLTALVGKTLAGQVS